jgi:hypothetical protein
VKFVFFFKNILGAISLKTINDTCVNGKMVCYLNKMAITKTERGGKNLNDGKYCLKNRVLVYN